MFRIPTEEEVILSTKYLETDDPEELERIEKRLDEIEREQEGSFYGRG